MRGLALSGGASFGAYQLGVWRALSENGWRPEVTTGISIGAVNAWLLAREISNDELERVWLEWPAELLPGRERRLDLPWRRQLPMFRAWVERIAKEYCDRPLICEGSIALLEAATGRMRTVSVADARAEHLLAACALPGVMAPVRTPDGVCLDCGIVRYIPLKETMDAGADEIIVVDLLAAHPFPAARRVRRAILGLCDRWTGRAGDPDPASLGVTVTVVGHATPLGDVLESFRWQRSFAERLFMNGYQDMGRVLDGRRHSTMPAAAHAISPSAVSVAPQ